MKKILYKVQIKTPQKIKIYLPIILLYLLVALTTIINIPNYALFTIVTISTLIIYKFIDFILTTEEKILKNHTRQVNHFQEIFVEVQEENKKLSGELEQIFKDFDNYVISSKTDLFGVITYASKALLNISGYTEEEMIGSPHNILRHPDMPASAFKDMWEVIEDDRIWSGEVKNQKKGGGFYWVRAIISPIYDDKGIKIGYNSIRQNITKEKNEIEVDRRKTTNRRSDERRSGILDRRISSRRCD